MSASTDTLQMHPSSDSESQDVPSDILVAGSLAVDTSATYKPPSTSSSRVAPILHTSNPATIAQSVGGVGYNIALAATLTGTPTLLLTAIASDLPGSLAISMLQSKGLSCAGVQRLSPSSLIKTAQYLAINDTKADLHIAMADMSILESAGPALLASAQPLMDRLALRQKADNVQRWLIVDANLTTPILHGFLSSASAAGLATAFEPVSVAKAARLFELSTSSNKKTPFPPADTDMDDSRRPQMATLTSPNAMELSAMHAAARHAGLFERKDWWRCIDALGIPSSGLTTILRQTTSPALVESGIPQQAIQLLPFIPIILVKLGAEGVLLVELLETGDSRLNGATGAAHVVARTHTGLSGVGGLYVRLFNPVEKLDKGEVLSVNGAGDTFLGALISGLVQHKDKVGAEDLVDFAQRASVLTLKSVESVSPQLRAIEW